jgi:hypothetical protein
MLQPTERETTDSERKSLESCPCCRENYEKKCLIRDGLPEYNLYAPGKEPCRHYFCSECLNYLNGRLIHHCIICNECLCAMFGIILLNQLCHDENEEEESDEESEEIIYIDAENEDSDSEISTTSTEIAFYMQ